MFFLRSFCLSSVLVLLASCDDEPTETRFPLGSHELVLSERGIELFVGGEVSFALSPEGPRRLSYIEDASGPIGIYTFVYEDEVREGTLRTSAALDGEEVLIEFDGAGGRGTLRVGVETATRVAFYYEFEEERGQSVEIPVRCDEDGSFHGFGVQYDATDLRGETFDLISSEQGIGRNATASTTAHGYSPAISEPRISLCPIGWTAADTVFCFERTAAFA